MTKLSFSLSFVDITAQKVVFTADPSTFSAAALEAIFTYGVRRWFQDHINSAAHTFKLAAQEANDTFNDDQPFDVAACFEARLDAAVTGVLSTPRSKSGAPALSDLDEALYAVAFETRNAPAFKTIAKAFKAAKGLDTADRKAAVLQTINYLLPEALLKALLKAAQTRLEQDELLAGLTV